jgi:hypothetical protein
MINITELKRKLVIWLLLFLFIHASFIPSLKAMVKDVHCTSNCCHHEITQQSLIGVNSIDSKTIGHQNIGNASKKDDCKNGACKSLFCSHCQKVFINVLDTILFLFISITASDRLGIKLTFYNQLFHLNIWHPPLYNS